MINLYSMKVGLKRLLRKRKVSAKQGFQRTKARWGSKGFGRIQKERSDDPEYEKEMKRLRVPGFRVSCPYYYKNTKRNKRWGSAGKVLLTK